MDAKGLIRQMRERIEANAALREEFERDPEGVIQRETGLTAGQIRQALEGLSEDDLTAIAGGLEPRLFDPR